MDLRSNFGRGQSIDYNVKKALSFAMLLTGTVVGAGFASGKEMLSFFGGRIPFYTAPIVGALIFGCSCLFLFIGKSVKADNVSSANRAVLGKVHLFADIFLLFNSLVVLAGMMAAMDSLFSLVLPIAPAYSIISGILCAVIVARGLKGLLSMNNIMVPVTIVIIVLICCLSIDSPVFVTSVKLFKPPVIIIYVGLNMMLASTVFITIKDMSGRQIVTASGIAAAVVTILMLLMIFALDSSGADGALPLMEMALEQNKVVFYLALAAIAVSIFTSMLSAMSGLNNWLKGLLGDNKFSIIIVVIAGFTVSNLGFDNVVAFLYPVIGVLGAVYILLCLAYVIRSRKRAKLPENAPQTLKRAPQSIMKTSNRVAQEPKGVI